MMIGGAMAAAAVGILPHAAPGFWPMLAMAAVLGGTLRLPLTAILFTVGVTGNTHVLLPLIVTCVSAYTVDVLLMRRDILTEKIARRGHHVTREWHADPFVLTPVGNVMVSDVDSVPDTMTLREAIRLLADRKTLHPSFPVIDVQRRVLGIIDPPRVIGWRHAGKHREATLGELFSDVPSVALAYPDEYLNQLAERMMEANVAHMPVVAREDSTLVGYIAWKDLLKVRNKMRQDDEIPKEWSWPSAARADARARMRRLLGGFQPSAHASGVEGSSGRGEQL
jgi:CBS domain-containing protein